MPPALRALLDALRGTPLHPQWLSDRYHRRSRRALAGLRGLLVLDVGCGATDHSALLGEGCRLIRLDYPPTQARYGVLPAVFATAQRLPFPDARLDAVLLLEVLEHVADDEAAVAEAARVLRPGGELVVSVPFLYPLHDLPYDYRRYTPRGLRELLARHGLRPVTEHLHGNGVVVGLQLLNLAVLEAVQRLYRARTGPGLAAAAVAWPLCLLLNLLAAPFVAADFPGAARFGMFCIARREPA